MAALEYSGNCTIGAYAPGATHVAGALVGDADGGAGSPPGGSTTVSSSLAGLPSSSSPRTAEAWLQTTGSGWQTVLSYGGGGATASYFEINVSGASLWFVGSNDNFTFTAPYSVTDGRWHSVTVTYDGNTMVTAFVDGQAIGAAGLGGPLATGSGQGLQVGSGLQGSLTGKVDEVAIYPTALTAAQVNNHWRAGEAASCPGAPTTGYAGTVVGDHPSRYLRLGETSGTVALDSSGNCMVAAYAAGATHVPGALFADSDGAVGNAAGGGTMVSTSGAGLPVGSSSRTAEAWINSSSGGWQTLLSYGGTANGSYFEVNVSGTSIWFVGSLDNVTLTAPYSITDGSWHSVAVTYDGGTSITGYVDGQYVGVATLGAPLSTGFAQALQVGVGAQGQVTGSVDEVAIYPGALTAAQIDAHWRVAMTAAGCPSAPASGYPSSVMSNSPARYLRLSESGGRAAADTSSQCRYGAYGPGVGHGVGALTSDTAGSTSSASPPGAMVVASADGLPGGASARTVDVWFKTTATSGALFSYGSAANGRYFELNISGANSMWFVASNANYTFTTPSAVNNGAWHYAALTYDGVGTVTLSVDGASAGSGTVGLLNTDLTAGPLLVGTGYQGGFAGSLQELAIYPTALTAAQLSSHYTAGAPVGGSFTSAPTGYDGCVACAGAAARTGTATNSPVNTANGNFWHSFSDISIPGRGLPLSFSRTYNAVNASTNGPLGYGWQSNVGMTLAVTGSTATITEANASVATFTQNGTSWQPAAPRFIATLTHNGDGTWTFVRAARDTYTFNASGQLTAYADINGYTTTYGYTGGNLTTVTDAAGRSLQLTWSGSHIATLTDANVSPQRVVTFQYNDGSGNLTDVFDVNGGHAHFTYDASHRMTVMKDALCVATPGCTGIQNVFDSQGRVGSQTDALSRQTSFDYTSISNATKITDPAGNVRVDYFNAGLRVATTSGYGSSAAATWSFAYDPATLALTATTDPNGHVVSQTVDGSGNVLTSTDALGQKTTTTYNGFNEVLTSTDPLNVTTTYSYDAKGNLTSVSRPLTGTTQTRTTTYSHADAAHPGDVTAMTDADQKVWTYAYDADGNRISSTDPLGDRTSWAFNAVGWLQSQTTPRGNVAGCGCAAQYTTTFSYADPQTGAIDQFGDVRMVTDPLGHTSRKSYDPDRNVVSSTDGDGNTTGNTFDLDGELTSTTRADQSVTKTDYNADGTVHDQVDGAGHAIQTFAYDAQARETSVTDALANVTSYAYDSAGNRVSAQDPGGNCSASPKSGCTTFTYDAVNHLVGITYSDGSTPNVTIGYDGDGQRTSMSDGSGASTWAWDSLHRLASVRNGNGQTVAYGYNLRGLITSITYPGSGKAVARGYDDAGRWTSLSDWVSPANTATFTYDADSNLTTATLPGGVVDTYTFNAAGQMTAIADTKGTTSVFTASYGRDGNGQLTTDSSVPAAQGSDRYTPLNQLCYAGSSSTSACSSPPPSSFAYTFSAADNLTQTENQAQTGPVTQSFNAADELCWATAGVSSNTCGSPPAGATTFGYDSRGNRTAAGSTSYGYDQANRLTTVNGGQATYAYNGDGLRMSRTVSGATTQFTWDGSGSPPLLLEQSGPQGVTDIVYGPGGVPVEQINPMPAITHVGTPSTAADPTGTGGSLSLSLPAGVQAGDQIVVATTYAAGTGNSATVPAGYTQVTSANSGGTVATADVTQVFRKTAGSGESAVTISYSGAFPKTALLEVYRGVDGVLPIDVSSTGATASGTSVSAAATTAYAGDELVMIQGATYAATGTGSWSPPSAMTEQTQRDATTTTIGLADEVQTAAGSTGTLTSQFSVSGVTLSGPQLTTVLLALRQPPSVEWFHHDQLGSTRALTDSVGRTAMTASYDPYGNLLGGAPSSAEQVTTNLLFNGQYRDGETGFYYLRARYFDPASGQFLSRDAAVSVTRSPYGYVSGNPLNHTDPGGLGWCGQSNVPEACSTLPGSYPGPTKECAVVGNGSTDSVTVSASTSCSALNNTAEAPGHQYSSYDTSGCVGGCWGSNGANTNGATIPADVNRGQNISDPCQSAPSELENRISTTTFLALGDVLLWWTGAPEALSGLYFAGETAYDIYDWTHGDPNRR
jgi:RHS repeat-associated protein